MLQYIPLVNLVLSRYHIMCIYISPLLNVYHPSVMLILNLLGWCKYKIYTLYMYLSLKFRDSERM